MTTTVQVSDEVRQEIQKLKTRWGLKSNDEVLRRMIRIQARGPESLFGAARGSKPFAREPEDEDDNLRD